MPANDTTRPGSTESEPLRNNLLGLGRAGAILAAVACLLYFTLDRSASRIEEPTTNYPQAIGRPLNSLQLQLLTDDSKRLSVADLHGKVTLINLWGPWCMVCRVEMPHLENLRKRFETRKDFSLVSVSCGPNLESEHLDALRDETMAYLGEKGLSFPIHSDPQGQTRRAIADVAQLQDQGLHFPLNLLLRRDGVICGFWMGYWEGIEGEIGAAIERELAK